MISDLYKDIKLQLYERASSPLLGSLAISWCLWNYKFLVVVFSSLAPREKVDFINAHIFSGFDAYFFQGFLLPVTTSLVFIFLYPYPAKFVYEFTRNRQKELKEIKQRIEDETPITLEESRQLKLVLRQMASSKDEEISNLNDELEGYKLEVSNFKKENNETTSNVKPTKNLIKPFTGKKNELYSLINNYMKNKDEIINEMIEILIIIGIDGDITFDKLNKESKIEKDILLYILDKLEPAGYISEITGEYNITRKGRAYLVENDYF